MCKDNTNLGLTQIVVPKKKKKKSRSADRVNESKNVKNNQKCLIVCKDNTILGLMQIFVPKKRKKNPGPLTGK